MKEQIMGRVRRRQSFDALTIIGELRRERDELLDRVVELRALLEEAEASAHRWRRSYFAKGTA
ncbi:MAG: hypothetical protein AAF078_11615 [Planctomycetota bacterium]